MNYCNENINENQRLYTNDKEYFVYKHTSPSNKNYIGITRQNPPSKRWANGNGYEYNTHFHRAILKYGWANFKHEILFSGLTAKEAEEKERELIAYYNSADRNFGYNIDLGGCGAGKISEVTKEKMSIAHMGINAVPVVQYSINGEFLKEYYGVIEAARQNNLAYTAISACCRGVSKTAGGYIWRYKSDEITEEYIKWCNINQYLEDKKTPIRQYSLKGNFIAEYESAEYVQKNYGYSGSAIRLCCKRIFKLYKNYIWRYADDILTNDDIEWCNNNNLEIPIIQYSIDGEKITEYKSITEANENTGVNMSSISHCCNRRYHTAGGFIWRYLDDSISQDDIEYINNNYKDIIQYSLQGEYIKKWSSAIEIKKEFGCDTSSIYSCCNRKNKTSYGYIWRYSNDTLTEEEILWCNTKKQVLRQKPNINARKPVYQYSKSGELINRFSSLLEVKQKFGYDSSAISRCCNKAQRLSYGYIWRFDNKELTRDEIEWCNNTGKESMKKKVYQYSLSGELVNSFQSIADIKRQFGYEVSAISSCCLNKSKTAYGFIWRYEMIE